MAKQQKKKSAAKKKSGKKRAAKGKCPGKKKGAKKKAAKKTAKKKGAAKKTAKKGGKKKGGKKATAKKKGGFKKWTPAMKAAGKAARAAGLSQSEVMAAVHGARGGGGAVAGPAPKKGKGRGKKKGKGKEAQPIGSVTTETKLPVIAPGSSKVHSGHLITGRKRDEALLKRLGEATDDPTRRIIRKVLAQGRKPPVVVVTPPHIRRPKIIQRLLPSRSSADTTGPSGGGQWAGRKRSL